MTVLNCGGTALDVDRAGDGPAIVLVHGAWSERGTWDPVFAPLAKRFCVVRYDRRGYGESQRPGTDPEGHVADLLALLRRLRLECVTLVGNSLGGLVALHAALRAPELIRGVIAHEPPIYRLLKLGDQLDPVVTRAHRALHEALEAARQGEHALAARLYVNGMASYTDAWSYLPVDVQQEFVRNADAFLADSSALDSVDLGAAEFERLGRAAVVTHGGRTSPYMKFLMERLFIEVPQLTRLVFEFGGHVPHRSSPSEFLDRTVTLVTALAETNRVT